MSIPMKHNNFRRVLVRHPCRSGQVRAGPGRSVVPLHQARSSNFVGRSRSMCDHRGIGVGRAPGRTALCPQRFGAPRGELFWNGDATARARAPKRVGQVEHVSRARCCRGGASHAIVQYTCQFVTAGGHASMQALREGDEIFGIFRSNRPQMRLHIAASEDHAFVRVPSRARRG